jgi:hypothetical protein
MRVVGLAKQRLQRQINDLVVREISAVKRAANPHARIMLRKSATEESSMSQVNVAKAVAQAREQWPLAVKRHAVRKNISDSKAADELLRDERMRMMFHIAGLTPGNRELTLFKLGSGLPQGRIDGSSGRADPLHDSYGPTPPTPPSARRPHPLDYSVDRYQHEDEDSGESDDEGHRLAAEAYDAMDQDVSKWMRQDRSLTKSKALDRFRTTYPNAWKMAMRYKPASPSTNRPLV